MVSISLLDRFRSRLNLRIVRLSVLGVAVVAFCPGITRAQWATNGNNINNTNTGNVGIGTTTPAYPLTINQTGNSVNRILSLANDSSGSSAQAAVSFFEGATEKFKFGMNSSGATSYVGGANAFQLWHFQNAPIVFGTSANERMRIDGVGNVGIGTIAPDTRLTVVGTGTTLPTTYNNGDVLTLITPNDSFNAFSIAKGGVTNPQGITIGVNQASLYSEIQAARMGVTTNSLILNRQGGNVGIGTAAPTEKLHVAGNGKFTGNLIVDGNIAARYQDLAEWVPSSEYLSAGTVVVLDTTKSNQVVSANAAYDTRVAGVISAQPGITLGESGEGKVLVATTGRVRVKVDASRASIQIGDLLVTSDIPGVAMKSEAVNLGGVQIHRPGTIIGKALEPLAKGSGEILVLLSLQ